MKCPVLYVEDEPDDVFFMRRAFAASAVQHPLEVVEDGRDAINYLRASDKYATRQVEQVPCFVLLDLNLPQVPGLDVLRWIRSQPYLCSMPVIIFSSSREQRDVVAAYELGANSFLTKPGGLDDLNALVRLLDEYWLRRNCLPVGPVAPAAGVT